MAQIFQNKIAILKRLFQIVYLLLLLLVELVKISLEMDNFLRQFQSIISFICWLRMKSLNLGVKSFYVSDIRLDLHGLSLHYVFHLLEKFPSFDF